MLHKMVPKIEFTLSVREEREHGLISSLYSYIAL